MTKDVRRWVKGNSYFDSKNCDIEEIAEGANGRVFNISNGAEVILKLPGELSEDEIEWEAQVLNFLHNSGIKDVPEVIQSDYDENIGTFLLQEKVGEKNIEPENLNSAQLENLLFLLAEIHEINIGKYNSFFNRDSKPKIKLSKIYKREFEEYIEKPFKDNLDTVNELDDRVETYFDKIKDLTEGQKLEIKVPQRFSHHDPAFNIRIRNNKVYLIDWEFSGLGTPLNDLITLCVHGDLENRRKEIFSLYEEKRNIEYDYNNLFYEYAKLLTMMDVMWAVRRISSGQNKSDFLNQKLNKLEELYE